MLDLYLYHHLPDSGDMHSSFFRAQNRDRTSWTFLNIWFQFIPKVFTSDIAFRNLCSCCFILVSEATVSQSVVVPEGRPQKAWQRGFQVTSITKRTETEADQKIQKRELQKSGELKCNKFIQAISIYILIYHAHMCVYNTYLFKWIGLNRQTQISSHTHIHMHTWMYMIWVVSGWAFSRSFSWWSLAVSSFGALSVESMIDSWQELQLRCKWSSESHWGVEKMLAPVFSKALRNELRKNGKALGRPLKR